MFRFCAHVHLSVFAFFLAWLTVGCTTYVSRVENKPGRASVYSDSASPGQIQGVGIESQDIISMSNKMMRDMIANPLLVNNALPRRVVVDSVYFRNESSNRININLLTDRLRTGLLRAANGRMVFVGRHFADMVEHERKLKSQGLVDGGTNAHTARPMGADYCLGGRITSLDSYEKKMESRFTQVVFEMVDLQSGAIAWSGQYSFKKAAEPSVFYR